MNRLTEIIDRHRKLLALVLLLITMIAVMGIIRLQFVLDPQIKFKSHGPEYELLQRFEEAFGSDSLDCLLLVRGKDVFTKE